MDITDITDITLDQIQKVTNNFSEDQRIGIGGYGEVYKVMYNGEEIAVKKFYYMQGINDKEFANEFRNLMKVKHQNIIRLIGYCYEIRHKHVEMNGEFIFEKVIERLLCFKYIEGGSLTNYISDESRGLDWPTRHEIIKGICQGLNHLHNGIPNDHIYHLDLKPDNILLDRNMIPIIADFGMSRLLASSKMHITQTMKGTLEYMPPEFIDKRIITKKYDVFSVGVIIIQLIAGARGYINFCDMSSPQHFIMDVCDKWKKRLNIENVHEKWLQQEMYIKNILVVQRCLELAVSCVEVEPESRPSIMGVVDELNTLDAATKLSHMGQVIYMQQSIKTGTKKQLPNIFTTEVEGGSRISKGIKNITMDASRHRVDIQSASSFLEHIILDGSMEPTNVPLALLKNITEDFADKRQIGQGGFGAVYKGYLQNGSIAVKRLFNAHTIDEGLFYREATCLISVKHENIVRFLGYCANTECKVVPNPKPEETMKFILAEIRERLLCFEYIKNGSLDKYLTDELRGLEWHMRYEVIKGICNGLDYLHNEKAMIHRDMKPANILVDDLMVPKITDFGVSKLLDGATHAVTSNGAMSFGYSAPEFIRRGLVSFKSDIYSMGVIITELVTGRKGDPDINNVLRRWRHRWNKSAKYPPFGYQQVTKCIEIALRCLSDTPNERPSVRDILRMLNAIESADVQINSAGESLVGPISPYPWELFEFDKLELNFPFEINKQIPCSLELTNVTNDYVAFDIRKTGMLEYCIQPNKGVVPARSKCIVIVTLQAREKVPYVTMCKDELILVRSAVLDEILTAEAIHEDMFNNESGKLVDDVTLTVVVERVPIT